MTIITYHHKEFVPVGWENSRDYNIDITPGKSIRIYGTSSNNPTHTPKPFDVTFHIGDLAIYDSYNFRYLGEILRISPKTVTIDGSSTGCGNKRLNLYKFAWRNHDFDLEKIRKKNHDVSMTI